MRALCLSLFLMLFAATAQAADDWRYIGHYSNLTWSQSADPHTKSGYSVSLYRIGNVTYGDIALANGSIEPARAFLHDIDYNPTTGAIRFKARHSADEQGRNAETLEFIGKVEPTALVGIMHATDYDSDDLPKKRMRMRIKRDKDSTNPWRSHAEWHAHTKAMIQ